MTGLCFGTWLWGEHDITTECPLIPLSILMVSFIAMGIQDMSKKMYEFAMVFLAVHDSRWILSWRGGPGFSTGLIIKLYVEYEMIENCWSDSR